MKRYFAFSLFLSSVFYWRHWTVRKELCLFGEPTGIHCLIFAMSHASCGLSQTSSKGRVPRSWSFCSCLSHTEWLTRSLGMPGECKTLETFSGISCVLFGPSWFTPLWNSQGLGTNNKVNIFSHVKRSSHFISFLLWGSLFMWFNTYQIKVIMEVPMMLCKEPNYSCLIPLLIQLVVSLSQANFPETLISWKMKIYFCMGTTLDWTSNST